MPLGTDLPLLVSSQAKDQSSRTPPKDRLQGKIAQATQPGPFGGNSSTSTATKTACSALSLHGKSLAPISPVIGPPCTHESTDRFTDNRIDTTMPSNPCGSFTPHDCQVDVPLDSLPVDATEVSDSWRIIPPSPAFYPHETITFSHSFRDYVDLLPDYDAMLI
jgi:hypothetical protein